MEKKKINTITKQKREAYKTRQSPGTNSLGNQTRKIQ